MKLNLNIAGAFFLCALITSCQKPFNDITDPALKPVVATHDSVTRLSELAFIDFRNSATDTTGSSEFIYDDKQRVTTINDYDHNNGAQLLTEFYTFYYTGNDSLAYKKIFTDTDPTYGYTETTFYFYDNLQRLSKDSTIFSSGIVTNQYNYSSQMIINMQTFVYNSSPQNSSVNTDTGFINNTGDVTKAHSIFFSTGNYITNFSYDDKKNPFQLLNIRSTYNPVPDDEFFLEDLYLQKNNVTFQTSEDQSAPGNSNNCNYTYSYNAINLPQSVDITYSFGPTDDYRIIFIYKKL